MCLEEDVRVLCRTSLAGMIRIQRMLTERIDRIHIRHLFQIFIIPSFDLLDLMGSTETIEEINKRKASFNCRKMCNRRQVHNFLYAAFAEHCTACLTAGIYVGMIAENAQRMRCQRSCRYVEHAGKLFARNLIKVGDHQKQSLRCRIGRCQGTRCQGTMNCARCARFGLHLRNLYGLSGNIFFLSAVAHSSVASAMGEEGVIG